MPEYHCNTCDYTTNIITHYNKHLRTKKHIKRSQKSYIDTNSYLSITNSYLQDTNSYLSEPNESKKIKCKYCDKEFAYKSGLSRHIKYYCKKNKDEDLKELVRLLNKEMEIMKADYKSLSTNNQTLINKNNNLTKQITQLSKKLQIKHWTTKCIERKSE